MLQHIKTDIIYYNTATDFEMEFNLCGCCRMRLLTEKAPDKKTLGPAMARAVSRSKIIIVIGNLFGENGIISITASAIGSSLVTVDNKKYGIASEEELKIALDAIPLVTTDGIFGGFLLVSGPQTMIVLSDSKSVRKNILSNLVFPYISELSLSKTSNKKDEEVGDSVNDVEPDLQQDIPLEAQEELDADGDAPITEQFSIEEQFEEASLPEEESSLEEAICNQKDAIDENIQDKSDQPDIVTVSGGMAYDEENAKVVKEDDVIPFMDQATNMNLDFAMDNGIDDYIEISEEEIKPPIINSKSINIFISVIVVLLLLLIAVLSYCLFYIPSSQGISATEYIKETFAILFGKA